VFPVAVVEAAQLIAERVAITHLAVKIIDAILLIQIILYVLTIPLDVLVLEYVPAVQ
jgi:hypothetical protein